MLLILGDEKLCEIKEEKTAKNLKALFKMWMEKLAIPRTLHSIQPPVPPGPELAV